MVLMLHRTRFRPLSGQQPNWLKISRKTNRQKPFKPVKSLIASIFAANNYGYWSLYPACLNASGATKATEAGSIILETPIKFHRRGVESKIILQGITNGALPDWCVERRRVVGGPLRTRTYNQTHNVIDHNPLNYGGKILGRPPKLCLRDEFASDSLPTTHPNATEVNTAEPSQTYPVFA